VTRQRKETSDAVFEWRTWFC